MTGSSPLARGLPERASPPARCPPDHPRSRGVYRPEVDHGLYSEGSSPLARGLRILGCDHLVVPRIIPARAGFTRQPCAGTMGKWDHPRSRGVYGKLLRDLQDVAGSSPLARGLPFTNGDTRIIRGIIPARAGFTSARQTVADASRDHPRSRGVYGGGPCRLAGYEGSSPLARGLRHRTSSLVNLGRIIPARAGFTRPRTRPWGPTSDHPRSRGVYGPLPSPPLAGTGSSPLARGFTSTGCGPGRPPRDHPRSRGVYTAVQGVRTPVAGSSPLARGLRSSGC